MNRKSVSLTYCDNAPSFTRKDTAVIKTLLPMWFRGADLKLAQATLKLSRLMNRALAGAECGELFTYNFNSNTLGNEAKFNNNIEYNASIDDCLDISISYSKVVLDNGQESGHIQDLEECTPIEGVLAKINDEKRMNSYLFDRVVSDKTKVGDLIEIVSEAIRGFGEGVVVTDAVFVSAGFGLSFIARNNHGRMLTIKLVTK